MIHPELYSASLDASNAADASDALPRDVSLAFTAFVLAQAAFELAMVLDSPDDVALGMAADYRDAVLGGLGGDC